MIDWLELCLGFDRNDHLFTESGLIIRRFDGEVGAVSLFLHRLQRVRAHILVVVVGDLFDLREVLLGGVEVVDRYLIHCDVHYRAVATALHVPEVCLSNRGGSGAAARSVQRAILLLDLLVDRLEDRRQKRLTLH